MPPRYAYWTILIDGKPTAFRARDKEELQPTIYQLKRKNADVVMKWFARGRLWDTPEQAQWAVKSLDGAREKRGRDWRPGGQHKDPRARFDKPKAPRRDKPGAPPFGKSDAPRVAKADVARSFRPAGKPDALRFQKPSNQRPWSGKPPRGGQRPWHAKPIAPPKPNDDEK